MVWSEITLICVAVVLVIVVFAWIATALKRKNQGKENRVDDIFVKNGVRYTKNAEVVNEKGETKVTLNVGDKVLERGKEYKVGKDLLAGKYTILSADENTDTINIRIGGLVREYKHFSSIALADGDTICAVSAGIILR